MDFVEWVEEEMKARNWKRADLAREGTLTTAQVTRVLNREQNPGKRFCDGIAKAFDVPPTLVYQRATLYPNASKQDEWVTDITHKLKQLPPDMREVAEAIIKALRSVEDKRNK